LNTLARNRFHLCDGRAPPPPIDTSVCANIRKSTTLINPTDKMNVTPSAYVKLGHRIAGKPSDLAMLKAVPAAAAEGLFVADRKDQGALAAAGIRYASAMSPCRSQAPVCGPQ
jgi:hypothetical protein